jgi:mRNA-degrading endonuclease RelE of RelBE toxin-antitoxin system
VAFPKERWRITKVANSAKRRFDKLNSEIKATLLDGMERLTLDPHEGIVRKIQGKDDIYRLRVDDFRIYYRLCSRDKSIEILLIDNKAGIKSSTIQRL